MASAPLETAAMKPSFAKVAASAYVPQIKKQSPAPQVSQLPATSTIQSNPPPALLANIKRNESPSYTSDQDREAAVEHVNEISGNPSAKSTTGVESIRVALLTSASGDDTATLLSSSDSSAKPASVDGKSVTSGTTFAMDEKESIRPDDSASIRAAPDEEDIFSAPGSVATGSRVGSETGARAFRDQLRELSALGAGPLPQRVLPSQPQVFPGPHPVIANGVLGTPDSVQVAEVLQPVTIIQSQITAAEMASPPPDEKLLEALQSPKDRLWVLKLEQDVLDFLKNEKEVKLALPQCNAFYRMLAHRFADYYFLGHVVDDTGTAVHLIKTTNFRIPPPLSGLAISSTASSTPPPVAPARKIMRRGEKTKTKSGTSTGLNSENPSKTASEAGESGSDLGQNDKKAKTQLTREEREAKYKEARLRIFGDTEANATDSENKDEDLDASRSSSASGKKKSNKKHRNYDNDGFEARSQFNAYYSPQYSVNGFGADGAFYGPYTGIMPGHYPGMVPNVSPPMTYGNNFPPIPPHDQQNQYGWQAPQAYPGVSAVPVMNMTSQNTGYDLSAEFNRSMQSFQNAPPTTQNGTPPRPTGPPMAAMNDFRPQSQQSTQSWNPISYEHSYPMATQFGPNYNDNRQLPSGQMGQAPPQSGPFPYNQMPNPYYNSPNRGMNHPVPGSFNRQQFNPQSQTFVPGGIPAMRVSQPIPHNGSPNLSAYGTYSVVSPQPSRTSPPQPSFPGRSAAPHPPPPPPQATAPAPTPQRAPVQQPQQQQRSPHPLPPNPLNSNGDTGSSIAKWGTPAHLPPKPPPPVSMDLPEKFFEANGSMPAHTFSGMPSLYPNHVNGVRGTSAGK